VGRGHRLVEIGEERDMKDFEVTVTVRNNRLKSRRRSLGLPQTEIASAAGIALHTYSGMETLRDSPFDKNGKWRSAVLRVAEYFKVTPWEIFPDDVVDFIETNESSTKSMELSASDLSAMKAHPMVAALPTPEEAFDQKELHEAFSNVLPMLTDRERRVLELRYEKDMTGDEIGEILGVGKGRVSQIEHLALRKMRHPRCTRLLRTFIKP
jgi:RNA polymerase sigma factor (sigma-70 family)